MPFPLRKIQCYSLAVIYAGVAELVDAPVLETGSERSVGSIPTTRTNKILEKRGVSLCCQTYQIYQTYTT